MKDVLSMVKLVAFKAIRLPASFGGSGTLFELIEKQEETQEEKKVRRQEKETGEEING
jgi:hypothetical protein